MKQDPRIDHITQDHTFDFAPSSTGLYLPTLKTSVSATQNIPWGISRVNGPLDGSGKKAWIIDTGIDLDHPDLNVDVTNSVSFVADESADDIQGHGTHVVGILAAKDNSRDVVGVAAGASMVAVKVLHDNPFENTYSEIIDGVDYVASKASPGDIVNMSLGDATPDNSDIDDAVIAAANNGIRFAIAAGNSSQDANNATPARVEHPNVWTVSAFRQGNQFVQIFDHNTPNCNSLNDPDVGSNFSNPPVDYSGPGENVLSLWKNGSTLTICGTSMAAPHIAGLLLAAPQGIATDGVVSNDPDSDPDPIAVAAAPTPSLSVSITGPYVLDSGEEGTWTAHPQDGTGSYSYQWYYQNQGSSVWYTGGTSQTFSHTFFVSGSSSENAGVKVEVTNGSAQAEDERLILITSPNCPPRVICI